MNILAVFIKYRCHALHFHAGSNHFFRIFFDKIDQPMFPKQIRISILVLTLHKALFWTFLLPFETSYVNNDVIPILWRSLYNLHSVRPRMIFNSSNLVQQNQKWWLINKLKKHYHLITSDISSVEIAYHSELSQSFRYMYMRVHVIFGPNLYAVQNLIIVPKKSAKTKTKN